MLSPAEFYEALHDQQERESTILDTQVRAIWETTRLQMMLQMQLTPGLKHKPKKPRQVFPLRWDKEEQPQSVEEMKAILTALHEAQKGKPKIKRRNKS